MSSRVGLIGVTGLLAVVLGCGTGGADVGGKSNTDAGAPATGGQDAGGGGPKTCDVTWTEICDGVDNTCDGKIDEGFDQDGDGFATCGATADCNDNDAAIHPGASELANGVDDNCDGKIDLGAPGVDYDGDGALPPEDCNDAEPLVGPQAVEVPGDNTDNNCNGQTDEALNCESQMTGDTAMDYARAIGLCGPQLVDAQFPVGEAGAHAIREKLGTNFPAKEGAKLIQLSSGAAKDKLQDPGFDPQSGNESDWGKTSAHPLWKPPPSSCAKTCGGFFSSCPSGSSCTNGICKPNQANDVVELKLTLKVPANAKSFSYQVNFFSAEYEEWVCTQYNDRFIAILTSSALDPASLPGGASANCDTSAQKPTCNITFDTSSPPQPLTVNNGFFDICNTSSKNTCSKPSSLLEGTGYEGGTGGATGWLTTKAPVTPGETITLRFIVLDEGDGVLDSAAIIDNFKWELTPVQGPETTPIG